MGNYPLLTWQQGKGSLAVVPFLQNAFGRNDKLG